MSLDRSRLRQWLRATAVRCIRTGAQAALGAIGAAAVFAQIEWDVVWGATVLAMLIAFLTCLAGLPEAPSPIALFNDESDPEGP